MRDGLSVKHANNYMGMLCLHAGPQCDHFRHTWKLLRHSSRRKRCKSHHLRLQRQVRQQPCETI